MGKVLLSSNHCSSLLAASVILQPCQDAAVPLAKATLAPSNSPPANCAFHFLPQLIGLGPHNPKKKQDLDKLYDLKAKAQQIMNQFGPSTLINLSNFASIKPEPASTPPQSSMANSTAVAKMPGTPSAGGRLSPESNQVISPLMQDNVGDAQTCLIP